MAGFDLVENEGGGEFFEVEGIPVALVHVVAGDHGFVAVAEEFVFGGIAFEVENPLAVFFSDEGEHFPADFIYQGVRAERRFLRAAGEGAEGGGHIVSVHSDQIGAGVGQAEVFHPLKLSLIQGGEAEVMPETGRGDE